MYLTFEYENNLKWQIYSKQLPKDQLANIDKKINVMSATAIPLNQYNAILVYFEMVVDIQNQNV